ncbi:hypothetical protein JX265_000148 [Neoarthrinium moseri]|uniref:Phosphotransferase n=1 Tax=Neoarthrinium moseri TaxID=1658444 RepID=A0A9P9WYC4_9PEZI|nr:hypothetical protein JX266_002062 [Neoarthrinium moseri]KAI1881322.1 hypothetical protein JX265_000148 [Neoarthrinium moseri]
MRPDLEHFLRPLRMDVSLAHHLAREFRQTFKYLAAESLEQFLPTPISDTILRPAAGSEKGRYLAIDIGGTNLRVGFIELLGNERATGTAKGVNGSGKANGDTSQTTRLRRVLEKSWPILEHLKNEKADDLFAWIGACIAEVVQDGSERFTLSHEQPLPLGVAFSFPIVQHKLSEATLMSMGKGFAITSNLDLGRQLLQGYEKAKSQNLPPIRIAAIANDSVATMVSFVYQAQESPTRKASMGLICGTGCNATIPLRKDMLHRDKVPTEVGVTDEDNGEDVKVAVNTEWTINGTAPTLQKHGLISEWDSKLDAECDKPGFQPLEYMTAGRYLGELGRLILVDYLTKQLGFAENALPQQLLHRYGLSTTFLSRIKPPDESNLVETLQTEFPVTSTEFWWTKETAMALYEIAKAIEVRAAGIVAAATIGLLACAGDLPLREPLAETSNQTKPLNGSGSQKELIVGYTGGCIAHFQDYLADCQEFLDQIIEAELGASPPVRVVLSACHDGGITGAGVLAGSSQARAASIS